jgi:hypothetical protein
MTSFALKLMAVLLVSAVSGVVLYGGAAWAQASTYLPVGVASANNQSGSVASIAWVLDTSRNRIIVCQAKNPVGDIVAPVCKAASLP